MKFLLPHRWFVRAALLVVLFMAMSAVGRAGEDEAPARKEPLRYAGKTFAEYKKLLFADIEPKARLEHLKPMAAFARHGLGAEVTETILEMMAELDYSFLHPVGEGDEGIAPQQSEEESAEEQLVEECVKIVARSGTDSIPLLRKSLQSDKRFACFFAMNVLAEGFGPEAKEVLPDLLKLTQHKNPRLVGDALMCLAVIGPKDQQVTQAVILGLQHKHVAVRRSALKAVSHLITNNQNPDLVQQVAPTILKALEDPDAKVSKSALDVAKAGKLGVKVIPALMKMIRQDDHVKQKDAFDFLREMGPSAKEAVPALMDTLTDLATKSPRKYLRPGSPPQITLVDGVPVIPATKSVREQATFDAFTEAVAVLESMGKEAIVEAEPVLQKLLNNVSAERQEGICRALAKIGNSGPSLPPPPVPPLQKIPFPKN